MWEFLLFYISSTTFAIVRQFFWREILLFIWLPGHYFVMDLCTTVLSSAVFVFSYLPDFECSSVLGADLRPFFFIYTRFNSVQFSHSVMSDSLRPHELQHARPPGPSPTPRVCSNSCPSSWWCHPAISSSVVPFSSCPQSLPASGSFPVSQLFAWGGQSIGVSASASFLPVNTQDWSPLGWTGCLDSFRDII